MATMKAAIMVFEWPGSSPCKAPKQNGAREVQPGVRTTLLQEFSEVGHIRPKGTW